MIKVSRTGTFTKSLITLIKNNSQLPTLVENKIIKFSKNPDDTRLRNHKLRGKLKGKWSFSITQDIRIVYEWLGKNTVRFLAIGGHKNVYGKN